MRMASVNDIRNPISVSTAGLAELQTEVQRLALAVSTKPGGGLRNDLLLTLLQLQRYALGIVHVDTGRLKNSIFTEIEAHGNDLIGHVATNVAYAPFEERRGGSHAFFARTVRDEGPNVVNDLFSPIVQGAR